MSSGGREVEVKYRVPDPAHLEAALRRHGLALSPAVEQDDQAYAEAGWSYGMSKIGVVFARLRTRAGRHLFTVKKPIDNAMSCLEYECEVSDRSQMHQAILAMGFAPTVRILKWRRTATSGNLSVCLDDVDHAGVFLELERVIGPGESGTTVQADLDAFARALGAPLERTPDTYDSLVRAVLAGI